MSLFLGSWFVNECHTFDRFRSSETTDTKDTEETIQWNGGLLCENCEKRRGRLGVYDLWDWSWICTMTLVTLLFEFTDARVVPRCICTVVCTDRA